MSRAKDLVFLVSAGRTGTNFFGDRLSAVIDGCFSVHEPDIFHGFNSRALLRIRRFGLWHMVIGRLLGRSGLRVLGYGRLADRVSEHACIERLHALRDRYHDSITDRLIVESNYQWWPLVNEIQKTWPQARVIAIIRDPRDWVRSCMSKGSRYDQRDPVIRFPPGRLTPDVIGEREWSARWAALGTFGRLAWEWRTVYGHLDANIGRSPTSRMFRFEDVFDSGGEAMRELVEFAATHGERRYPIGDLSRFVEIVRNASDKSAPQWPAWSAAQARLLDELCGRLMRRYGYGEEPQWKAKLAGDERREPESIHR